MKKKFFIILLVCFLFAGCQTTASSKSAAQSSEKTMDVRSAIEAVADVMTTNEVKIKYCPVCGRRFSPSVETCPYDGATLKILE